MKRTIGNPNRHFSSREICRIVGVIFLLTLFCSFGYAKSAQQRSPNPEQKKLNNALATAILNKDMDGIERAIAQGANPNAGLIAGIRNKDIQIVKLMLARGAKPNIGLYFAVINKDTKMAELMLSLGGTPKNGLCYAIDKNDASMVNLMLSKGALPDDGLEFAVYKNNIEMAKLMLSKGAVSTKRYIAFADKKGYKEIKELLMASTNGENRRQVTSSQVSQTETAPSSPAPRRTRLPRGGRMTVADAVSAGDVELLKELLKKGSSCYIPMGNLHDTPLIWAIKRNDTEIAEILINSNSHKFLCLSNDKGEDALIWAISKGNKKIVDALLKNGVQLGNGYMDCIGGDTPLLYAMKTGKQEIALSMIRSGDKRGIDAEGADGFNPITLAASFNNKELALSYVKELVKANADKDFSTKSGDTALIRSVFTDNPGVAEFLIAEGADAKHENKKNWTAFQMAIDLKRVQCAKAMIEGAKKRRYMFDIVNNKNFYFAIQKDAVEILELLLPEMSQIPDDETILHALMNRNWRQKHQQAYQMLVRARQKRVDAKEAKILSAGIPDSRGAQEKYAFLLIAKHQTKKFEELIKDDRCELSGFEGDMFTEAARHGCLDIARFLWPLLHPRTDFRDAYFAVMARGDKEFFKYLLAQNARFDWKTYGKEAVLHAAAGGSVEIMKCLFVQKKLPLDSIEASPRIKLPCSPYHRRGIGIHSYTALSIAAHKGDLQMVQYLVSCGANVNQVFHAKFRLPDETRPTYDALMCAANAGQTEVCLYLISKGANPNFISTMGENSVLIAKKRGFTQCMEALIKAGGISSKFELRKLEVQQMKKQ